MAPREISFDSLPQAVTQIFTKVENIERLLLVISDQSQPGTKVWFDIDELCNYIPDKPAKATVYGWVHNKVIPCHKGQKKLRFLKSEIDTWLNEGRRKTRSEIEADAGQNLKIRRAKK